MTTATNGGWIESIPAVEIELLSDGNVRVTDKSSLEQDYSVDLHPIHLRLIAEKLGLVREMSASEADALRTVNKLARRMRVLHGRIKQVHEWMWQNAEAGFDQCDINVEAWYVDATLDLSKEFMDEIEESRAVVTPKGGIGAGSRGDDPPPSVKPNGFAAANPAETQSVSGKACSNRSGRASATAPMKPSAPGTGSLFGVGHE